MDPQHVSPVEDFPRPGASTGSPASRVERARASTSDRPRRSFHQSAGAVVMAGGRCLVIHHADRDEWVLPKGHLEAGETPVQAAAREVREETGLDVRIGAALGWTRYSFGGEGEHRKRVDWFLAEPVGGRQQLEPGFSEVAFVDEGDVATVLTHPLDREVVRRACELLRRGR